VVNGTAGVDTITAGPAGGTYNLLGGADSFTGSAAADLVTGGAGNDAIDGDGGTDTAAFSGARANYYIYTSGANVVVHDLTGADGTDTLSNVENLQFTDGTIASTGFTANEAPVVSAGGPYYAQVGQAVVIAATASDADTAEGDVITYAWDLDNDGQFDDSTSLSPTLSGGDITTLGLGVGDHTITLRVTDATGAATDSAVTLTIAAPAAPVISSDGGGATASLNVAENTLAVTTAAASDANLNDTVTYSITGDDAALFTIDANTGALTFNSAPNHEAPTDVGADNVYNVTVTASDNGALTDTQDLTITVTDAFDDVFGTAGADVIAAGTAGGSYFGLGDNDTITGSSVADVIEGGEGNDIMDGGAGADTMTGGDGDDIYYTDNFNDVTVEALNQGTDEVRAATKGVLTDNIENLTLLGTAAINGTGNALNNVIVGNSGANRLNGMGGADTMTGGDGSDTYYVDDAGDTITELSNEGTDRIDASVTFTLSNHVETLVLTGSANIDGTGNALANTIQGNSGANVLLGEGDNDVLSAFGGADTLDGGVGADRMTGGDGNDTYYVDNVGDGTTELTGQGLDHVISSVSRTLGANIENLTLTGTAINAIGNNLANELIGTATSNRLNGMGGADTMTGGAGDDSYYVDNTGDVIVELSGEGNDRVDASVSYTLTDNVERLTLSGIHHINATGNALNNAITGNEGRNTIHGGGGADTINGGAGKDTLYGDAGNDAFVFTQLGAANWDAILDYNVANDVIRLEDSVFTGLGPAGALTANQFHIGASAADADDHIIYNSVTGNLYYDADGAGGAAQVLFAQVTSGLALTSSEFVII
jgi:Ca2+-binding RTX toxin-like protein